ncbi:hypothetical protein [Peribacillus muralis]
MDSLVYFRFYAEWIGAEGTRLLRECESKGDPVGASAEEAPGPPAESECL